MISKGFVVVSISSIVDIVSVLVTTGMLIIIVVILSEISDMIPAVIESCLVFDTIGVSVA